MVFSPDGKTVLTGSWDKTAQLWEVPTGKAVGLPMQHQVGVQAVAFSPDGNYALSRDTSDNLKLWEVSTGRKIRTFRGHSFREKGTRIRKKI